MGRDLEEDFEDRKTSDSDNDAGDDDGIEEGVVVLPGERDALRSRSVGDTPDAGRDSGWEAAEGEMTDFRRVIASGIASPIVKQTWRTRTSYLSMAFVFKKSDEKYAQCRGSLF